MTDEILTREEVERCWVKQDLLQLKPSHEALRAERDELQATFDLRWNADMRAIELWRAAGADRELTMPDHADLCFYLFSALEQSEEWRKLERNALASRLAALEQVMRKAIVDLDAVVELIPVYWSMVQSVVEALEDALDTNAAPPEKAEE